MDRLIRILVLLGLITLGSSASAQQSCGILSQCPPASTPYSGAELLYLLQGGLSKKASLGSLQLYAGNSSLVFSNAALAGLQSTAASAVVRAGFSTPGDSDLVVYKPASSCPYDGGTALGGSCVSSADGKFWVLQPQPMMDIRDFGAFPNQGSSTDEGPQIRAACRFGAANGDTTLAPGGVYWLTSLDSSGLGAIVMQGSGGVTSPGCDMQGTPSTVYPNNSSNDTGCGQSSGGPMQPEFILGAGLNRPLLYVGTLTYTPNWDAICLDGNRGGQTGWSGGPNGKLYVVQIADWLSGVTTESAIKFNRINIQGGYNGCLYEGAGRGGYWSQFVWCSYSGQSTADVGMFFNGCDTTQYEPIVGGTTGIGMYFAECSQHQVTDGALYSNNVGVAFGGNAINYLNMKGTNIQLNNSHGAFVYSVANFSSQSVAGIVLDALSFDNNCQTDVSGSCADFYNQGATSVSLASPMFTGAAHVGQPIPNYNIYTVGNPLKLTNPVWPQTVGTPTFTGSNPSISMTNNFIAGQPVYFIANVMPTGLTEYQTYYVITAGLSGTTFEVSATLGGGAITPSTSGANVRVLPATATTAFTNNWAGIICSGCNIRIPWTPVVSTSGTVGTPTYTASGWYQRFDNEVFVHFNISITAWSGSPTGSLLINGLPLYASLENSLLGTCALSKNNGWTRSASNYTTLNGNVSPQGLSISFNELAADGTTTTAALVGQFSATMTNLIGECMYETDY